MKLDPDELKVLEAGLALTLLEVPGISRMPAKEAMDRVKIVHTQDDRLSVYVSVDITPEANLSDIKAKVSDFVDRLLKAYFEVDLNYDLTLEVENVKE